MLRASMKTMRCAAPRALMVARRPISIAVCQPLRRPRVEQRAAGVQLSFSTAVAKKDEEETTTLPAELLANNANGFVGTGALLTGAVIMSQELYIVNDETMLATAWLALMYAFVQGGGASVAEHLDDRSKTIEDELNAARELQKESVQEMISKADAEIEVNNDLLAVCDKAAFEEWTQFKMDKTLQKAMNDSSAQTSTKLATVQRIEEAYARRKLTSFVEEVQAAVVSAIEADASFKKSSIDDAITGIAAIKA